MAGPDPGGHAATSSQRTIAVWVVEDNALYRRSLAGLIDSEPGFACALAVGSCEEALAALDARLEPDVVLMDIGLPGLSGIEGAGRVRSLCPTCRVVMLTVHEEDERVFAAICAGASGYLLKPAAAEEILAALRQVVAGGAPINGRIARRVLQAFRRHPPPASDDAYRLTPREREILELLVDGLTMKQIAVRLEVSFHTIEAHLRHIYDKLHVRSRSGAVAKAVREGLT